jgi:hypothetical protein
MPAPGENEMNLRKILFSFFLALVMILTGAPTFAGPPEGMFPPPGPPSRMGPAGLTADKQFLYVVAGPTIMQYSLADLKLVKTVDLPRPAPPKPPEARPFPPPPLPPAGPQGLWAGEGALYVLAGPRLYRFSTPDLTLKNTAELPKPEPPMPGQ